MKQKLFTLLTLLVLCVTGAWADDLVIDKSSSDWTSGSSVYATAGTVTIKSENNAKSSSHKWGQGTTASTNVYIQVSSKSFYIASTSANITKIEFIGWANNNTASNACDVKSSTTEDGTYSVVTTDFTATRDGSELTSLQNINMNGYDAAGTDIVVNFTTPLQYISIAKNSKETWLGTIKVWTSSSSGDGKTTLTGAWSPTSVSIAKGAETPSNPTFEVTGGSATLGTHYKVTYSEVSDDNNIVSTDASSGITAISTSTAGTATVRATVALTTSGEESYSLPTETYDITINVSNIATLFSMTNITGPTDNIIHQADARDVQATFSAGGSATVYNGHDSNDTKMCDGYIYLNGSGNSYLHIVFPTKLKAGDVIKADGSQKGGTDPISWRISKTSSVNNSSNNKTCPYTLTEGDALIGATELYFGKNSGAFITSLTIEGEAAASDLKLTSEKNITIATDATSDITFTSSNTTGVVTYTSSATGVATVDNNGHITGVAPGTAVITIEQASDGTIRAAATTVTVKVERARKDTEVSGEYILDTTNGSFSGKLYTSTDESVFIESSNYNFSSGNNTYNDLKNSHFKHTSNMTITLPTNYPVSSVWFVGYRNGDNATATITLKKVDGESVTEKSGTIGGSNAIPTADCVGFKLTSPATKSIDINISNESRGYFILNPAAQNITLTQVGENYYSSYYSVGEMTITGATAYTAALNDTKTAVTLTECADGVVPGRTGVILIGNSASATATPSFTGAEKGQGQLIGAAQKDITVANYYAGSNSAANKVFVLGIENEKAGLYKYTGTNLSANKAYLYNEELTSAGARSLSFEFENETTAINGVSVETVKNELKKFFENGQLIIEKNGMKFNAAGQQIK